MRTGLTAAAVALAVPFGEAAIRQRMMRRTISGTCRGSPVAAVRRAAGRDARAALGLAAPAAARGVAVDALARAPGRDPALQRVQRGSASAARAAGTDSTTGDHVGRSRRPPAERPRRRASAESRPCGALLGRVVERARRPRSSSATARGTALYQALPLGGGHGRASAWRSSSSVRRVTAAGFSVLVVLTTAGGSLELKTLRRRLGWSKAERHGGHRHARPRAAFVSRRRRAGGPARGRRAISSRSGARSSSASSRLTQSGSRRRSTNSDESEKRTFSELCRKLARLGVSCERGDADAGARCAASGSGTTTTCSMRPLST